jgi:hypothetical protein
VDREDVVFRGVFGIDPDELAIVADTPVRFIQIDCES